MVKKILIVFTIMVMAASSAIAAENGFYFGLKFIDSLQSTGSLSRSNAVSTFLDTNEYTQNTIGGGVFIGYDFYPASEIPLRTELEYAIRTNSTTSWDGRQGLGSVTAKGQWGLQTLFVNAYWDFHNSTAFTPYIGVGLGLGFLNTKYSVDAVGEEGAFSKSVNDVHTVFAWNAGVGVSYAITDNLSADLAYRFVGLGYSETEMSISEANGPHKFKIGIAPYANEFSLGVRYTF